MNFAELKSQYNNWFGSLNILKERPHKAYPVELAQFHSADYVEFLQRISPDTEHLFPEEMRKYCPVFDDMLEFCQIYAGETIDAKKPFNSLTGVCDSCIRFPRGNGIGVPLPPNNKGVPVEVGKGRILLEGTRVAILGYSSIVQQCLGAASLLEAHNISATVANARFCKPLDAKLIKRLANEHEVLLAVEEGSIGGFGSHVAHFLSLNGLLDGKLKACKSGDQIDMFLMEENEEIKNQAREGKIHELSMKLALQKSQNLELKNHFQGLSKHMEGLTKDIEKSHDMVLTLEEKIKDKDAEIQRLKQELQQKDAW
nr:probable 1-deoxy-D-xylulose-5-phosphate synthase 2, chloroplastic [Tanacetum cinerariifolium]